MLLTPSYKDYLDYFYNFGITMDASIEIIVFVSVLLASILYYLFLEDKEIRSLAMIALTCYMVNNLFNVYLVRFSQFGEASRMLYVSIQTILFDTPYQAFLFIPAYVTVAKLIPDDVESSIFSILKAI